MCLALKYKHREAFIEANFSNASLSGNSVLPFDRLRIIVWTSPGIEESLQLSDQLQGIERLKKLLNIEKMLKNKLS